MIPDKNGYAGRRPDVKKLNKYDIMVLRNRRLRNFHVCFMVCNCLILYAESRKQAA